MNNYPSVKWELQNIVKQKSSNPHGKAIQGNLFDSIDRAKQSALAKAVDEVNRRNGHDTIRMAIQGYGENWKLRNEYVAKQYTTNIRDIIIAKAK